MWVKVSKGVSSSCFIVEFFAKITQSRECAGWEGVWAQACAVGWGGGGGGQGARWVGGEGLERGMRG